MNITDLIVLCAVAGGIILVRFFSRKISKKTGCDGNCSGCNKTGCGGH